MSRLDELIAELCPDGVRFHKLNELFNQFSGMGGVSKKWADEGNCRFIDYMNAYTHISIDVTDLPFATVKKLNQTTLKQGDVLFTSASETPDECAISSVIEDEISDGIFLDDHLFGLRINDHYKDKISPSFLKYAFRANSFRSQMKSAVRGVTRFYVSKADFLKLEIPVPPLEVQREIVRILDSFTELTAELQAELQARKKQYEYYRDQLLDFRYDQSVPQVTLGSVILSLNTGLNPRQFFKLNSDDAENYYITIREIVNGNIVPTEKTDRMNDAALRLCNNRSNLEAGDVLFSGTGTIGETAVIEETPKNWNIKEGVYTIKPNPVFLVSKYLRYLLMTQVMKDNYMKKVAGGTVKSIPMKDMRRLQIPLPTLERQQELVDIIERFDRLCNDISSGLPAEIDARQKQYEYYRDKLLTFRELSA